MQKITFMNKTFFILICLVVLGSSGLLKAQTKKTDPNPKGPITVLDPVKLDSINRKKGNKKVTPRPAGQPAPPAIQAQQQQLTPEQKEAQGYYNEGMQKAKDGNYLDAIGDYTRSIETSGNTMAYMSRGFCYMVITKYDLAIADATKALELSKTNANAYYVRGVSEYYLNDLDKAEKDLSQSITYDRKNPASFNYVAAIKLQQKDYKGALDAYTNVIKLDSSFNDAFTNRGMVRHYLQDYNGAILDYKIALKQNPENPSTYNNIAAAKLMLNDNKGALKDLDKAIELNPKYRNAYNNRGRAKQALGDTEGACKDWYTAFDLGLTEAKDMIIKYCK